MKSTALLEALSAARPGCCALCSDPLPRGRRKFCGSLECRRLYHLLYTSDFRARRPRPVPAPPRRGEDSPTSKLTVAQVLELRALAARHVPQRQLARRFHISQTTVCSVVHGRLWAHVPREL